MVNFFPVVFEEKIFVKANRRRRTDDDDDGRRTPCNEKNKSLQSTVFNTEPWLIQNSKL